MGPRRGHRHGGTFHVNYDPDDESDEPNLSPKGIRTTAYVASGNGELRFMRHLSAFASVGLDFEIDGFNEWAFDRVATACLSRSRRTRSGRIPPSRSG
jgi:hypothetical protein